MKVKTGDIFEVCLNKTKGYFQFISLDPTQLNSEVVRVFNQRFSLDEKPDKSAIVDDDVQLYMHLTLKVGLKKGLWEKAGNIGLEENLSLPWFRSSKDYGNPRIKISKQWYVWQVGCEMKYVGELADEQKQYCIGVVHAAKAVPEIMLTGKSSYFYPSY